MTDLDLRVRSAIHVLADAEPVNTPPFESTRPPATRRVAPGRVRLRAAAIAFVALALAATAVGAAGLLPASITDAFHRISSWSKTCHVNTGSARLMASYRVPDGRDFEWWRAVGPIRADGTWTSGDDIRTVSATGQPHDQVLDCATIAHGPSELVLGAIGGTSAGDVLWGQAPEGTTTAVRAVYRDGTTVGIPLQHGRYFMTVGPVTTPPGPIVRVEALDANGAVIASEPDPNDQAAG